MIHSEFLSTLLLQLPRAQCCVCQLPNFIYIEQLNAVLNCCCCFFVTAAKKKEFQSTLIFHQTPAYNFERPRHSFETTTNNYSKRTRAIQFNEMVHKWSGYGEGTLDDVCDERQEPAAAVRTKKMENGKSLRKKKYILSLFVISRE